MEIYFLSLKNRIVAVSRKSFRKIIATELGATYDYYIAENNPDALELKLLEADGGLQEWQWNDIKIVTEGIHADEYCYRKSTGIAFSFVYAKCRFHFQAVLITPAIDISDLSWSVVSSVVAVERTDAQNSSIPQYDAPREQTKLLWAYTNHLLQ